MEKMRRLRYIIGFILIYINDRLVMDFANDGSYRSGSLTYATRSTLITLVISVLLLYPLIIKKPDTTLTNNTRKVIGIFFLIISLFGLIRWIYSGSQFIEQSAIYRHGLNSLSDLYEYHYGYAILLNNQITRIIYSLMLLFPYIIPVNKIFQTNKKESSTSNSYSSNWDNDLTDEDFEESDIDSFQYSNIEWFKVGDMKESIASEEDNFNSSNKEK